MGADANKDTIRRIYEAMALGDTSVFSASVHPDYVWRLPGHASWSGEHHGREAILRDLIQPLFARFAGRYSARLVRIFGEGDLVCAEVEGRATVKGGGRYDNFYCFVFRFRGDKIAEVTEYADTDLEERVLGPYPEAVAAVVRN